MDSQSCLLRDFEQSQGLVIDPVSKFYVRTSGHDIDAASTAVSTLYSRSHGSHIVSSGMNAIMLTFMALQKHVGDVKCAGDGKAYELSPVIIMGDELYSDTQSHVVDWLRENGFRVLLTDPSDYSRTMDLVKEHKERLVAMFFESCSNPSGAVVDWKILQETRELNPGTWLIIDNTWLSPAIFNPFEYGAHIVLESGTKYLSGGQFIIGQITTCSPDHPSDALITRQRRLLGIHVSPLYCRQLVAQLASIQDRVIGAVKRAQKFLKRVDEAKGICAEIPGEADGIREAIPDEVDVWNRTEIQYSGIPNKRFASGIIYFKIKIAKAPLKTSKWKGHVLNMIEDQGIKAETSYGKPYDSICNWVHRSHDKEQIMIRLAFGYDNNISNVDTLFRNMTCLVLSL